MSKVKKDLTFEGLHGIIVEKGFIYMLLAEVAEYLASNGIGTQGTNIFIGHEPVAPVNVVTLYPTGGPKIGASEDKDTPTMQVRVRNSTFDGGWTVAWNVFKLLDKEVSFLSSLRGRCFAMQSQPTFIGRGANEEFLFTQNFMWKLIRP